jgi:hypothetical protein
MYVSPLSTKYVDYAIYHSGSWDSARAHWGLPAVLRWVWSSRPPHASHVRRERRGLSTAEQGAEAEATPPAQLATGYFPRRRRRAAGFLLPARCCGPIDIVDHRYHKPGVEKKSY